MGRDTAAGASRAASKARAASRAASSASGAPGGGFGGFGFGGYAGGVALDTIDDASSDAIGDEEVERALRRCAHKSSTATKLKALRELYDALFGDSAASFDVTSGDNDVTRDLVKSPDVLMMMLKPWTRAYEKLSADGDVGVRRDATIMHGHIARASGKSLAKILKGTSMMPSWVKTMSDPNGEVAQTAREAFSRTFSTEERRSGAIAIAHVEILDDLGECLRKISPADMLFREGSENEQFGRFERSILVSLGALAATCSQLHEVESADADKAAHACSALVLELKCLSAQVKSEYSSIRREAYATLATLAKCGANAKASPAWREALARCVPSIAAIAFALISTEQDQACISHMWELIIGVAIAHPSAWDVIDVEKSFVPGVCSHFARACHGAAVTSAPSLLPLLAHMPAQSLITRSDDLPMSGLIGMLDAVFTGWLASSASAVRANEAKAMLPALREGVLYGILKLAPMTDHAEECAQVILHTRVVDRWMREFLAREDADALDIMCDALKTLGTKPHSASAVVDAWSKLGDITEDALRDPERADVANGMYSRMLAANAGAETLASTAVAPFAMAVFANALETPSLANSLRLSSMIEHLGVAIFDGGADAIMRYCLSSPTPVPGAGTIVAAVMKRDAVCWDEALEDALAKDDTRVVAEALQTLVKEQRSTPDVVVNAWARDTLDTLVERCATMIMSPTDVDVLVAVGGLKDALTSTTAASATLDVFARDCANLHESPGLRRAMRAWMWPPPSAAAVIPAWSACVGAFFHEVLQESLGTTSAYRVNAEYDAAGSSSGSGSDVENDEIEFEETGEINREWIAMLWAVKKDAANDAAMRDAQNAAVSAVASTSAYAAWEHRDDNVDIGVMLRLWAQKTVHALIAFNSAVDPDVAHAVARAALKRYAGDNSIFRWLDALSRTRIGWRVLFDAMIKIDIDDALDITSYALTQMPAERDGAERAELVRSSRKFSRVVCGRELRRATLPALIKRVFTKRDAAAHARSGDREDAVSVVVSFLRRARELDENWNDDDDARDALEVALVAYAGAAAAGRNTDEDAAFAKVSLAKFLPHLLPSDISNESQTVRSFVDGVVQACVEGIRDRRAPLDGPTLALVAACFTRSDTGDGDGIVGSLNDAASAAALMEVFRALAKRDAADAAAEAAAARFGAPQRESVAHPSSETTIPILSGDAGAADVTIAIIRRCPAALDARDWGAVFGRMGAWMSPRVSAAAVAAYKDDRSAEDITRAADMLARVVTIVSSIAALPVEVAEPRERNAGDVVPYAARGADAVRVARALAAADWPRERAEIMKDVYACVILAGADCHEIIGLEEQGRYCYRRMALERDMWRTIADCACAASSAASSAALRAALYVDDLDDAPCETVSALYALLLEPQVDDGARRAAYAMLASDALLQSAVVGIDARVADVAKVERALDGTAAALNDYHQPDGVAFIDGSSPAERAGVRVELDDALRYDDIAGRTERYAWALLLRYISALDVTSSCHERLVNYTRETKAMPRMLRAIVPEMPLPHVERGGKGAVVALSAAWRDADWTDPTAPAQMFNARLSVDTLLYGAALRALPASVRTFVHDLKPAKNVKALEAATAASVSSTLIAAEFAAVSATSFSSSGGSGDMSVRASASTREVLARYEIDESFLELVVKLPNTYPLEPAELRCVQRVGIHEQRLRKWMLGMSSILTHQNGAVAQCLLQWQRNITAEFSGVEPCPICYSVIHPVDHRKPSLRCRQCSNTFHATCLYTWFRTGSRSICPLCQQQWGTSLRD